jgi:hypothetical protein
MRLEVIAFDQNGKPVNWTAGVLTINGSSSKDIATRLNIDLPAGKIDLVTGIYDLNSGDTGTLEIP